MGNKAINYFKKIKDELSCNSVMRLERINEGISKDLKGIKEK